MNLNSTDKELKDFSFWGSIILFLIGGFLFYKEKIYPSYFLLGIGFLFLSIRIIRFQWIQPIHFAWMSFAKALGFINTRIILFIVFILTVVPISLLLKLFRKDILDKNLNKEAETYWTDKEKKPDNTKHYERHF
jgi:hypothetical protein